MSVFNIFAYEDEPFAGDVITEYEFIKLKHKFDVKNVVETGSYVFSTTKWFGENIQTVYFDTLNDNKQLKDENKLLKEKIEQLEAQISSSI